MPVPDFFFALQVDDVARGRELVGQVAVQLLHYAGDATALVAEVSDGVGRAVSAAAGRCTVVFRANDGTLEVVVRDSGVEIWRAARPLP